MTLRPVILVAVLVVIASASPAPEVETSFWNNLVQIGGDVEVKSNNEVSGRSDNLEQTVENYIKNNDISFKVPIIGSTVTLTGRNLDSEELDLKLNYNSGSEVQARKKSKLKKIFIPILVFILLKAMTLIPLALGILGIKTWNAMQLSFVSFIAALGMAVYKLFGKVGSEHHHPQIIHNAWEPHAAYNQYAARADSEPTDQLAYSGYTPQ